MSASQSEKLARLEDFLRDYSHITLATPSSANYAELRDVFCLDNRDVPLAIVRPRSADDVSLLLKFVKLEGIKFVVRTGGHNLFGQSQVEGALTIDMRDIAYVRIHEGHSSANIGGGILQAELVAQLAKEGLATAIGTVSTVGYVGWATYGGYGPFSANYGLGVDQILSAKIVDWRGEVVEANEKLLKGIRGAGGVFGIIVEITIKVYPLETVFAGTLMYDSRNISETFKEFNIGYRELSSKELPPQLTTQQMVINSPHGRVMGLGFMWSSPDAETGRIWLAKFESLGTVLMNTVAVTNIPDWFHASTAFVPTSVYGSSRTHNLREMSNEAVAIICDALEKMPLDPATMFSVHQLRGPSAYSNSKSVFGTRDPHFMLEILGCTLTEENRSKSLEWAFGAWDALNQIESSVLLPGIYISLDPPALPSSHVPLSKIFGSNDEEVLSLKRLYDSQNVFDMAVPRLKHYL